MIENYLGPALTCAGLLWSFYQFYLKKHEERAAKDRGELVQMISNSSKEMQKEIKFIKEHFGEMKKDFETIKALAQSASNKIDAQSQLMLAQAARFDESIKRLEKTLDRHEQKLDSFGSVKLR